MATNGFAADAERGRMEAYERAYLDAIADNLAASVASAMRDGADDVDLVESEDLLTASGRLWVHGYLTSRLSTFRAGSRGNPNLSREDLELIAAFVDERQGAFAAELYS